MIKELLPLIALSLVAIFIIAQPTANVVLDKSSFSRASFKDVRLRAPIKAQPAPDACDSDQLKDQLTSLFRSDLTKFDIMKIDRRDIMEGIRKGAVLLPLVDIEGRTSRVDLTIRPQTLYSYGISVGHLKGPKQLRIEKLPINFQFELGRCNTGQCGVVTEVGPGQYEGLILDQTHGLSFFEPVDNVFKSFGKDIRAPGCHVAYNAKYHRPMDFVDDDVLKEKTEGVTEPTFKSIIPTVKAVELSKTIPIILDADSAFYNINPATVWSRQTSIFFGMNFIYSLIEPITSNKHKITFDLKGQEAWLPGFGPSTTDGSDLSDLINQPGYYMVNHPVDDDLSLFYAGKDMDGSLVGKAGRVCSYIDVPNRENHAWSQMVPDSSSFPLPTFYARVIVAAHEIGHQVGGRHGSGSLNECAGGLMPGYCGITIMPAGSGGQPESRKAFFSDANDDHIISCIG